MLEKRKAINIGSICVFSYLASYYMRNLLSVSTPAMLDTGLFTKEMIGLCSSVYFLIYAVGQLLNGMIGDKVSAKKMVFGGLLICGISSIAFAFCTTMPLRILIFALMGFSLSMLRGPLVKTISENTLPKYARICCTFFSFAAFAGPFIASFIAMLFDWKMTFIVAGASCVFIAVCAYVVLSHFEKKGMIKQAVRKEQGQKKNIWSVFKLENFMFYLFVGALVEISGASISFWMPTYLTEHLNFENDIANIIFSFKALIRSFVPFVSLFMLRLFKDNDVRMSKYAFLFSTIFFIGVWLVPNRYINVVFFFLALISVSFASSILWNVYIPNQAKSGMVSTINGVLDFSGYVAAAVANIIFSAVVDKIGWNGVTIIWILLMLSGVIVASIPKKGPGCTKAI